MVRIRVRAFSPDGFYRAHRYWPGEWVEDEVDEKTLAILQAERNLAVDVLSRTVDDEPAPPKIPPMPSKRL